MERPKSNLYDLTNVLEDGCRGTLSTLETSRKTRESTTEGKLKNHRVRLGRCQILNRLQNSSLTCVLKPEWRIPKTRESEATEPSGLKVGDKYVG